MLGKRKRDTQVVARRPDEADSSESQSSTNIDASVIFRNHFETTFAPLPEEDSDDISGDQEDSDDSSGAESDVSVWSGLSEASEDVPVVEVVDHAIAENGIDHEFHRARQKAFMSSRPPRELEATSTGTERAKPSVEDDPVEKLNLKHDLDLQRLLKESHLLEKTKAAENPGKQRQLALDLRLQALGAKQSAFAQQKMPVAHRVGITKKADQKETLRRKDAKENGVILEKANKTSKNVRRDRGVDVPGVGKFAGGTLKLSRQDIASIQGPPRAAAKKGRKR